jgi:hypothetical protein
MFDYEKFIKDMKEKHLKPREATMFDSLEFVDASKIIDLDERYEYEIEEITDGSLFQNTSDDKNMLRGALSIICNNVVGRTLLKLLMIKHGSSSEKIGLVNYQGRGSRYDKTIKAVLVNLSLYKPDGSGVPNRQYYSVDSANNIVLKQKSLEKSIFHELVHCLHYTNDGKYAENTLCREGSAMKEVWDDDEELRTITGYMCGQAYDPICDHVFDYSLHGGPFCPRYGHGGWSDGEEDETQLTLEENLINQTAYLSGWTAYNLLEFVSEPLPILSSPPMKKVLHGVILHRQKQKPQALPYVSSIVKPCTRKTNPNFK